MNDNITSSSPLDSYETSENVLLDSFKAAALKVTTLYKDSLVQNRKAYASGYQQALQDLYEFISSHPKAMESQQETVVSPTGRGFLPVQDLLTYARQRNDQLTSEIRLATGMDQSASVSSPEQPQQQATPSSNISPSLGTTIRSQQQQKQDFNSNVRSQSTYLGNTGSATGTTTTTTPMVADTVHDRVSATTTSPARGGIGLSVKNAFHPFQIDPSTQFTFSLPVGQQPGYNNSTTDHHHQHRNRNHQHQHHYYYHHQTSNNDSGIFSNNDGNHHQYKHINDMNEDIGVNDRHHHHHQGNTFSGFPMDATPMEGFKRRFKQQELTFLGRTLNNMNIDSTWNEPAFKRRFKKDD